jgi:hypothetical protein
VILRSNGSLRVEANPPMLYGQKGLRRRRRWRRRRRRRRKKKKKKDILY